MYKLNLSNLSHDWSEPQAQELTPSKEVVWALASWTPSANLSPLISLQFLDELSTRENMHFGLIH